VPCTKVRRPLIRSDLNQIRGYLGLLARTGARPTGAVDERMTQALRDVQRDVVKRWQSCVGVKRGVSLLLHTVALFTADPTSRWSKRLARLTWTGLRPAGALDERKDGVCRGGTKGRYGVIRMLCLGVRHVDLLS
jgi:hypothetical protein